MTPVPKRLTRLRQLLRRAEIVLASGSLLLLLGLALGQIVARNLFDSAIPHAETVERMLVLYIVILGAGLAVEERRHIHIDLAAQWWPALLRRAAPGLQSLAALVCALLAWAAARYWLGEWQFSPKQDRPMVLMLLILPIGFALHAVHFAVMVFAKRVAS